MEIQSYRFDVVNFVISYDPLPENFDHLFHCLLSHRFSPFLDQFFLVHCLLSHRFRPFLDQFFPERLISQIEDVIRTALVHVAIFSEIYFKSQWCLAENHTKGGFGGSFSSAKIGRAGILPRTALGDITNGVESCKAPDTAVKRKKVQGKNVKMGPNPRYELTEEENPKADAWAREGIERNSGKDMEALKEKIAEEEVNSRVAQALSYRTEIPCFLPRALQKDSSIITDVLEFDPVEDLCKKGDSPCDGDDMMPEDVDYDDSLPECLENLQNASKNWLGIMEDCVYLDAELESRLESQ